MWDTTISKLKILVYNFPNEEQTHGTMQIDVLNRTRNIQLHGNITWCEFKTVKFKAKYYCRGHQYYAGQTINGH